MYDENMEVETTGNFWVDVADINNSMLVDDRTLTK